MVERPLLVDLDGARLDAGTGAVWVETVRGPPAEASAANGAAAGPTAIDAETATAAPLRRAACLRPAAVISRRWMERRSDRSHRSKSLRSRLFDSLQGNDDA